MEINSSYNVDPHDLVHEFHTTYGMPVGQKPQLLTNERELLRIDLITEEYTELLEALSKGDFGEAVDALGDLTYVVYGMAIEMGVNLGPVLEEIHASNMSKLGEDGRPIYREDGKVLKGPNFRKPDILNVIFGDNEFNENEPVSL